MLLGTKEKKYIMTIILIIAGIILMLYLFSKKSSKTQASTVRQKEKSTYKHETESYGEEDGSCSNCGGLGYDYHCENCFSKPTHSGFSEHYDGDLYCSKCMDEGKEFDNIVEDICLICCGTGKHNLDD